MSLSARDRGDRQSATPAPRPLLLSPSKNGEINFASCPTSGLTMELFWDVFSIAILLSPLCIKLVLQWLNARNSGWHRLGHSYGGHEEPAGKRFDGITIGMNGKCYQRIATASVTKDGLYLSLSSWHRILHPPLLIPWTQMKIVPDGWNTIVQAVAPLRPVSMEFTEPLVQEIVLHVGRHSPYWLPESRSAEIRMAGLQSAASLNSNSPSRKHRRDRIGHEVF
jgi:hypothetical protein